MRDRDTYTSTVEGAAGHAAQFADDYPDDRPTLADVAGLELPSRPWNPCRSHKVDREANTISWCIRGAHAPDVAHEPGVPVDLDAYRSWVSNPPF